MGKRELICLLLFTCYYVVSVYNNLLIILDQLIKFQVEKPLANILFVIYLTYKNAMFKIFKVQYMYIIYLKKMYSDIIS